MEEECMGSREKYWSECDDKEKIKRLREQVKGLQRKLAYHSKVIDKLIEHTHLADGTIVIPINESQMYRQDYYAKPDDDVYF